MPQFDGNTVATQLFWLVITFAALYFVLWKSILPKIAGVLEARQEKIDDDLDRAGAFKKEAEDILADYERSRAETAAEAQALIRQTSDELAADAAAKTAELGDKLGAEVAAGEARIKVAKEAAEDGLSAVAAETAQAAVERLIGVKVDEASARSAVAAAGHGTGA
ncbi:MAG: F0F1 ATP synthase subunit B' [Pseudomonadota bacterium]